MDQHTHPHPNWSYDTDKLRVDSNALWEQIARDGHSSVPQHTYTVPVWSDGDEPGLMGFAKPTERRWVASHSHINWETLPAGSTLTAFERRGDRYVWLGEYEFVRAEREGAFIRLHLLEDGQPLETISQYQWVIEMPDEWQPAPEPELPPLPDYLTEHDPLDISGDGVIGYDGQRHYGIETATEAWDWNESESYGNPFYSIGY